MLCRTLALRIKGRGCCVKTRILRNWGGGGGDVKKVLQERSICISSPPVPIPCSFHGFAQFCILYSLRPFWAFGSSFVEAK